MILLILLPLVVRGVAKPLGLASRTTVSVIAICSIEPDTVAQVARLRMPHRDPRDAVVVFRMRVVLQDSLRVVALFNKSAWRHMVSMGFNKRGW